MLFVLHTCRLVWLCRGEERGGGLVLRMCGFGMLGCVGERVGVKRERVCVWVGDKCIVGQKAEKDVMGGVYLDDGCRNRLGKCMYSS